MVTTPPGPPQGRRTRREALIEAARAYVMEDVQPDAQPVSVAIRLNDGSEIVNNFPPLAVTPSALLAPAPSCSHSPDFRSAVWYGTRYTFTPTQAAVVKQLWAAWEAGAPEMGVDMLLVEAGSQSGGLAAVFKGNQAFGAMIVTGDHRTYRLADG